VDRADDPRRQDRALRDARGRLTDASDGARILALLMETGYPTAVATLLGGVDGTSSLYFSNGGGYIGAGSHAAVAEAFWRSSRSSTTPPLAGKGTTQFVAVTPEGLRGAAAPEDDLGNGRHALSPLFHAAQDVITQIRLTQPDIRS
jgi:hypothetical protein